MKSLLLGSAATLLVVAGAQAADLPTKKGAPAAQYVRICNVNGIAGFIIPGSDTCLKIGAHVYAQYTVGSTATEKEISVDTYYNRRTHTTEAVDPKWAYNVSNGHWKAVSLTDKKNGRDEDATGFFARARMIWDAVSPTAYGPLVSHLELDTSLGSGFDNGGRWGTSGSYVNSGYIQWAGITAGVHPSFFSFIGGGAAWDNIISPNGSNGGNQPPLLAYTATFGGGFAATLSLETPDQVEPDNAVYGDTVDPTRQGMRAPVIIAALDLTQNWGTAHIAGLAQQDDYEYGDAKTDDWGWGVIGGVGLNIPQLGPGADFKIQGAYLDGAAEYSGFYDTVTTNLSGVSWNGANGDVYYNTDTGKWEHPKWWSVAAVADIPFGPNFKFSPEVSYGEVSISNLSEYTSLSKNLTEFIGGAVFEWDPVKNLIFQLDLLYVDGHQDKPSHWDDISSSSWKTGFSGFNGKLRIERDF